MRLVDGLLGCLLIVFGVGVTVAVLSPVPHVQSDATAGDGYTAAFVVVVLLGAALRLFVSRQAD